MLNLSPENPQFYLQKSQYLLELGNIDQAIAEIETALKLDVNFVYGLNELANIYEQQNQLDLALEYRQQVVELQPNNHSAYHNVSQILMAQGRFEDAILVYKKSLALLDPPIFIYLGLANALKQNGQLQSAKALYQYTTKLFPDSPELAPQNLDLVETSKPESTQPYSYFFQKGRELISQGDYQQAIAVYAEGNKQHRDHPFSYFMLGNAYGLLNDYARQLDFYARAVNLDLKNFQFNLENTTQSRSILNDNQINNIYQRIVNAAIEAQQTQYLPRLIESASQRLNDYSFLLATARELINLDKSEDAIAFLEQLQSKCTQLDFSCSESSEIQYLLVSLKQAQENRNALKDCNYQIISLGCNSFPATIGTTWGLKASKYLKQLNCPFDLAVHSYESVIKAIETDFNNYLNREYLISVENSDDSNKSCVCLKNTYYDCIFTEDKEAEFTDGNFDKFIEVYRQRISNFYQYINSQPVLFLLAANQPIETDKLVRVLASKFPKLDFKVMLLLFDNQSTLSSTNANQDVITYRVSGLDNYSHSAAWSERTVYEENISNEIKKVILDNF